jgi:hypothetical protein
MLHPERRAGARLHRPHTQHGELAREGLLLRASPLLARSEPPVPRRPGGRCPLDSRLARAPKMPPGPRGPSPGGGRGRAASAHPDPRGIDPVFRLTHAAAAPGCRPSRQGDVLPADLAQEHR